MYYASLEPDKLLQAVSADINQKISLIAGYAWFLYQDSSKDSWTKDDKKLFAEQIFKAASSISAAVEAAKACEELHARRKQPKARPPEKDALATIAGTLHDLARTLARLAE